MAKAKAKSDVLEPGPNPWADKGLGVLEQHRERLEEDEDYRRATLGDEGEPGPNDASEGGVLNQHVERMADEKAYRDAALSIDPDGAGGAALGKAVPSTVPTALAGDRDE